MSYKDTEKSFDEIDFSEFTNEKDMVKFVMLSQEKIKLHFRLSHLKELETRAERLKGEKKTSKNKKYDGNDLNSACDVYGIAAQNWAEIIRFEDGYNFALQEELSLVEREILEIQGME